MNETGGDHFVAVLNLDDLPQGSTRRVVVHYREVLLSHLEEGIFAMSAVCPHARGPLWKGVLSGTQITCPWHSWTFDVRTGVSPGGGKAATFPVRIDGGQIFVDVGPRPATPPPPPIELPEDM